MTLELKKTEWDLGVLFSGDEDPAILDEQKAIEEKVMRFARKWKGNKRYLEDPKVMREALDEYNELFEDLGTSGKAGYYLWLRRQQDQNDPKLKGMMQKLDDFSTKLDNELNFFGLSISKMDAAMQEKFLADDSLKDYRHYLRKSFARGRHLLSEEAEKVMALKSASSHEKWVEMTSGFLSKEEREILTEEGMREKKVFEEIMDLVSSKNKEVRDGAGAALNDLLRENVEVAEAEINAILSNKKVNDELRGFDRPDSARHLGDDIETGVVDAMLEAVSKRFDISSKYYQLKAKLLGQDSLQYHERNVPYGDIDKKYTYEEAGELVYNVMNKLDSEFAEIFSNFAKNGQIDVYPRKGKRGGAFCVYWSKSMPTFIMLNFNPKLRDVTTLAHELGHGINDELMKRKQKAVYFSTSLATAEVASTFMEDFVLEELENGADEELKLALMMSKLNDDISTIFRQVACYRFEQELHSEFREKGYLSKEELGKIFQKHMALYMGDYVEQSDGSENWWVYWSHIRSFFYVYSYASGLLISKAMQREVRNDKSFISKVKEFLAAGSSDSPKNIFMKMGIDITRKEFWETGLNEIEDKLNEAETLAKKLNKI